MDTCKDTCKDLLHCEVWELHSLQLQSFAEWSAAFDKISGDKVPSLQDVHIVWRKPGNVYITNNIHKYTNIHPSIFTTHLYSTYKCRVRWQKKLIMGFSLVLLWFIDKLALRFHSKQHYLKQYHKEQCHRK